MINQIKKIMVCILIIIPACLYADGTAVISNPGQGVLNIFSSPDTTQTPIASLNNGFTYSAHLAPDQSVYLQFVPYPSGKPSKLIEIYAPSVTTEELFCSYRPANRPVVNGKSLGIKLYGQWSNQYRDDVCNTTGNVFNVSTQGLIDGQNAPVSFVLSSDGDTLSGRGERSIAPMQQLA